MIGFRRFLIERLITNQLLYQLSYEGAKSFLVENIKLSKPNKDNRLFCNNSVAKEIRLEIILF
jgi:hypothetical protein